MKLYRGIHLSFEEFINFDLNADLIVPYEPIIDDQGRKCVADGNEYGVYMTDNEQMVLDVYGKVHHQGSKIDPSISFDGNQSVCIPEIAIAYEMDKDKVKARKPFITSVLKGHYNNGFMGDEWITDKVSKEDFHIIRLMIGSDTLHEEEVIPLTHDYNALKEEVIKIMKERIERLKVFIAYLKTLNPKTLRFMNSTDLRTYKKIFGKNGYYYLKEEDIDISTFDGVIDALCYFVYSQNKEHIDLSTLKKIDMLKLKLRNVSTNEQEDAFDQLLLNEVNGIKKRISEIDNPNFKANFEKRLVFWQSLLNKYREILEKKKQKDVKIY